MKRRNFLLYVAGSSLGIYGGRYLYRTSIKPGPIDAPASIAALPDPIRHRLLVPGSSGPLGNLYMSDAPLTLHARSTTLPFIQNKQSHFLIYDAPYGGNA